MLDRNYYGIIGENDEEMDEREELYCKRADSQMQWMEEYLDAMEEMENICCDE